MPHINLSKVVAITGASSGIGKELAKLYCEKKYRLILVGRNEAGFKEFIGSNDIDVIIGDLTKSETRRKISELVKHKYKRLDILINNAGITYIQSFENNSPQQLEEIIAINLKTPILLTHELYEVMKRQKSGHIVFINSSAGREGYKNHTLYSATKFGLAGFAKSLRLEAKSHGIKVTSVHPGGVKTGLYRNAQVDTSIYMSPADVANAVVSLTEMTGFCPDELVLSRMS